MPTDTSNGTGARRPSAAPREPSAASLGDNSHQHSVSKHGGQKHARHVVGHSRLGPRNPSFGRNLSKVTTLAAREEDSASLPRNASLLSPRPKAHMKRNHSSAAIMPKTTSSAALRKNHSSGQLLRNQSAKQLSKAGRPEYGRSQSQPHAQKAKRKQSPAPATRQATVHFDVGSEDDDVENMEDVDDGWTEGSSSPNTTRDNTRSNTRSGSIASHFGLPHDGESQPAPAPPTIVHEDQPGENGIKVERRAVDPREAHGTAQQSSYHENGLHKPLDAEDVAKRLLQKQGQSKAAPLLSNVSISASTEALDPRTIIVHENGTTAEASSVTTPLISRFIDAQGSLASKDGTPVDAPNLTNQSGGKLQSPFQPAPKAPRSPTHAHKMSSDIKRNQSLPSFTTPHSPNPEGGSVSGTTTPGGGLGHGGRIQQKMWLQRGLSEMESRSSQNLRGMANAHGKPRLGAQPDQSERIETELKVVRRYRHPVEESMERLRKLKDSPLRDYAPPPSSHGSPGKKSRVSTRDGTRTPGGASIKTLGSPPVSGATFSLPTPGEDDNSTLVSFRLQHWEGISVDDIEGLRELEDVTLDLRRQMWELQLMEE